MTYYDILNDDKIIEIYNQIEIKTNYVISHGLIHVKNVLKLCKNIAKEVKLSNQNKKLLYIACVLHDVGRFYDNNMHNLSSEKFAKEYLKNKLLPEEIDIVCNAIKYHSQESADFENMDSVAYCLILADKLDSSKTRLLKNLIYQAVEPKFDRLKFCNKMEVKIINNELLINIYQNNRSMEDIIKIMDKKSMNIIYSNFVKHFKLKNYKYNFILEN